MESFGISPSTLHSCRHSAAKKAQEVVSVTRTRHLRFFRRSPSQKMHLDYPLQRRRVFDKTFAPEGRDRVKTKTVPLSPWSIDSQLRIRPADQRIDANGAGLGIDLDQSGDIPSLRSRRRYAPARAVGSPPHPLLGVPHRLSPVQRIPTLSTPKVTTVARDPPNRSGPSSKVALQDQRRVERAIGKLRRFQADRHASREDRRWLLRVSSLIWINSVHGA